MKKLLVSTLFVLCLSMLAAVAYADTVTGTVIGKKKVGDDIEWTMGDKGGTVVRTPDDTKDQEYKDMQKAYDEREKGYTVKVTYSPKGVRKNNVTDVEYAGQSTN